MITRRKNYTKQAPTRDARKLYIFCEGVGTEPSYFSFFEGLSTNLEIITVPPESGTDPLKLLELAKSKLLDDDSRFVMDYRANDSVWFVIDTDSWEKEGKIIPLRAFCDKNNIDFQEKYTEVKPYGAWNVVQSNPSFEIWLYYHFFKDCPNPDEVEIGKRMNEHIDLLFTTAKIATRNNPWAHLTAQTLSMGYNASMLWHYNYPLAMAQAMGPY